MSETDSKAARELTEKMEATMQILQSKFQNLSDQIVSKMDDMGTRINDLEHNVADLMTQAGMGDHQSPK